METIVFACEQKNEEFNERLKSVFGEPYVLGIKNENCGVQPVSLFNKRYVNPGIVITSYAPDITYDELCYHFLQQIPLGLIAVRIVKCENEKDIMSFMKFDFHDKDVCRGSAHSPIILFDDPDKFEPVMFAPIDIVIKPLTYINFSLPRGAEIELMLYQKKD